MWQAAKPGIVGAALTTGFVSTRAAILNELGDVESDCGQEEDVDITAFVEEKGKNEPGDQNK